ncbi:sulfite reductase subunit alpha [Bosea sp. BK604]|uniref:sulfite reductase subunit alpha n=1 Tax=Bosea sp. BK604 TaxID=2512180 RepID=UPI00104C0EE9|nr:sulfite reductase subunit alpha [Bosea sp. BK604]TCR64865.1 NAD(P)H-dependent nitrite reductase flavoprotein subunit [Bosea sp. BK604]
MTVQSPNPLVQVLPETAPFSEEQRSWLNGFFAGLLSLDNAGVTALSPAENAAMMAEADDGAPWHDPAMEIGERMKLAEGKPLPRRLFAAMAQQDCGQCGYVCATYSAAIAEGKEGRLNLCAPGGKDTLRMLKALTEEAGSAPAAAPAEAAAPAAPAGPVGRSRENPALATFMSRRKLNGEGSEKETYHVEFDLTESGLDYVVGDAFGIVAQNDPRLVDAVIALLGARPDADIGGKSLRDVLLADRDLGPAPDALFQLISYVTGGETRQKAKRLAAGEDPDGDLDRLDVLGTLHKFSSARLSAEAFVEALDELQPRLYSISSSFNATPGRISLTVDTVRYRIGTRPRWGVASTYLAERVAPGDKVKVYVQRAHGFGLPENSETPVIMCGPGTGIAPFRAFLHDRKATKAPGRNWLFFGHQRRTSDFFYEDELNALKQDGVLHGLTLAWSRDGKEKIYVQDRMRERGAELFAWLEQGAHFYVCGDAKRMAKDVERAMVDVVAEHGKRSADEAVAYVAALKKAGRYQADVY